jgi:hypothetical protein
VLPPSLLRLRLGAKYEQRFIADSFACCQRLRELDLSLCCAFRPRLADILPDSLQKLRLHREYPACQLYHLPHSVGITNLTPPVKHAEPAQEYGRAEELRCVKREDDCLHACCCALGVCVDFATQRERESETERARGACAVRMYDSLWVWAVTMQTE